MRHARRRPYLTACTIEGKTDRTVPSWGNVRALVFIYLGKVRNGESADEQANERGGYGSGGSCLHRSVRIQRNPHAHTRIPGGHPYALNGDSYGERP